LWPGIPRYDSSLTCHPAADEIRSPARTHDNIILYTYIIVLPYSSTRYITARLYYLLHVRDVYTKRKLRAAKRRNDNNNNNNSIDMPVRNTPTELGRVKRLHSPSVRFFSSILPNSRWPTDDELQSSGRGQRRITSSSLRARTRT